MELFRKKAIEHQGNRLYGDVALTTPVSTWALTGLLGAIIAGIGIALFLGSYARKETVSGWLIPDKGLVKIVSPQLGTIATVHVEEGQAVDAGAHLITLNLDTVFAGGDGVIETALSELEAQIAERQKLIKLTARRKSSGLWATTIRVISICEITSAIRFSACSSRLAVPSSRNRIPGS